MGRKSSKKRKAKENAYLYQESGQLGFDPLDPNYVIINCVTENQIRHFRKDRIVFYSFRFKKDLREVLGKTDDLHDAIQEATMNAWFNTGVSDYVIDVQKMYVFLEPFWFRYMVASRVDPFFVEYTIDPGVKRYWDDWLKYLEEYCFYGRSYQEGHSNPYGMKVPIIPEFGDRRRDKASDRVHPYKLVLAEIPEPNKRL